MDISEWEDITPNVETSQEMWFNWWISLEKRWGEFGEPGINRQTTEMKWERVFGHTEMETVEWYLYRGDDGKLLGAYAYFIRDGQPAPFLLNVHPDHTRQGIATAMVNKSLEDFGIGFDFLKQTRSMDATEDAALWGNDYVRKKLQGDAV